MERTAHEPRDASLRAVVLAKSTPVGEHIRLLQLHIPAGEPDIEFAPGQWVDTFCPGIPKAGGFTITSAPSCATTTTRTDRNDDDDDDDDDPPLLLPPPRYIELAVKRAPDNPAAAWLWGETTETETAGPVPLGQTLHVRVGGRFVWPPAAAARGSRRSRYVFVAGGVGINPIMSMVSAMAEAKKAEKAEEVAPVHILYSVRNESESDDDDILFLSRLTALLESGALRGRLTLFLTPPPGARDDHHHHGTDHRRLVGGASVEHRRMTTDDLAAAVRGDDDDDDGTDRVFVYVCGVPAMTDAFVAYLRAPPTAPGGGLGLPPEQVLFEKWW